MHSYQLFPFLPLPTIIDINATIFRSGVKVAFLQKKLEVLHSATSDEIGKLTRGFTRTNSWIARRPNSNNNSGNSTPNKLTPSHSFNNKNSISKTPSTSTTNVSSSSNKPTTSSIHWERGDTKNDSKSSNDNNNNDNNNNNNNNNNDSVLSSSGGNERTMVKTASGNDISSVLPIYYMETNNNTLSKGTSATVTKSLSSEDLSAGSWSKR